MAEESRSAVDVYLSAGSNVAPEKNLSLACRELAHRFGLLRKALDSFDPFLQLFHRGGTDFSL